MRGPTPRLSGSDVKCLRCRAPFRQSAPPETGPEAAPEPRVYPAERFRPAGGGAAWTAVGPLVAGVVAAVVLGAVAAVLRQFFWLVLVFQAALGAGIGYACVIGGRLTTCRRAGPYVGAGVVVGLLGALFQHYVRYLYPVPVPALRGR